MDLGSKFRQEQDGLRVKSTLLSYSLDKIASGVHSSCDNQYFVCAVICSIRRFLTERRIYEADMLNFHLLMMVYVRESNEDNDIGRISAEIHCWYRCVDLNLAAGQKV